MDPHRLAEERSIAMHARVAELLLTRPELVAKARSRVEEWSKTGAVAPYYVRGWRELLAQPSDLLRAALVSPDERMKMLRQVSPFAGALDARERWRIHRAVAENAKETS